MEVWVPIEGFPRYSVSSYGRVRNDETERILTVLKNRGGVAMVGMYRPDGVQIKKSLGKLVATAFVEVPRYRIPFDTVVHLDNDKMNNHPSNLIWRPQWFAWLYHRQFAKYSRDESIAVRDCGTGEEYDNIWEVIVRNGLLYRDIVVSVYDRTPVFPTFQRFEWVV